MEIIKEEIPEELYLAVEAPGRSVRTGYGTVKVISDYLPAGFTAVVSVKPRPWQFGRRFYYVMVHFHEGDEAELGEFGFAALTLGSLYYH